MSKKPGQLHSAVLDEANGKLLVVTDNQANGGRPSLFRCSVDGSACMHTDISTGLVAAGVPSAVIDAANGMLLAVSNVGGKPGLFRCNLDGTGCAFVDISAGRGGGSGSSPSAVFDAVNGKLLVATTDGTNMACRPAIFRCNADGTGCVYSTPPDQGCATAPSAVIDPTNGRLLVATSNNSFLDASYLVRCNVDGSGCLYTTMGVGPSQALNPSAVVDLANAKLLVAGTRSYMGGSRPSLIRCELNGTGCLLLDISAGQPAQSGLLPSAVVDAANGKLLVATQDGASGNKPALFRCNLDGTACTYTDISAGQGNGSGSRPSAVLDTANGKLLVATDTGLFSVCVR